MRRWPREGRQSCLHLQAPSILRTLLAREHVKKHIRVTIARAMTEVGDEGADSFRVTIILVPKDEASLLKKMKRTPQSDSAAVKTDEDKMVTMERSRLRKCSNYFATCMSGRWATDRVFHLELQTQPRYYHDCFARMKSPFLEPIPSITHGIELFKVASQIEYHALMDTCEKFLAAAPWSTGEEDELRSLCAVGELPSDSDLAVRLRFPLTKKARMAETQSLIQRTLSRYLANALDPDSYVAPRKVFAEAFQALCKVRSSSQMGQDALVFALDILTKELGKILVGFGDSSSIGGWESSYVKMTGGMLRFCWMFQLLRGANAAQVVVELLLKHDEVSDVLLSTIISDVTASPDAAHQWAKMIYCMFQDILGGRLFLKSSERMTLFLTWNWVLEIIDHLAPGEPPVSELVASLVMSFPQLQQEEIFFSWEQNDDHYTLPNAHAMWFTSMVRPDNVPNHEKTSTSTVEDKVDLPKVAGRSGWDML